MRSKLPLTVKKAVAGMTHGMLQQAIGRIGQASDADVSHNQPLKVNMSPTRAIKERVGLDGYLQQAKRVQTHCFGISVFWRCRSQAR